MEARSFTVASILILMAIASSEGAAPVEQKIAPIAPVSKSASIYQSHYEAPIETSGEEIEDGADYVFDMLLQVEAAPAKKKAPAAKKAAPKKAAPKKAAPKAKAAAKPKAAPKAKAAPKPKPKAVLSPKAHQAVWDSLEKKGDGVHAPKSGPAKKAPAAKKAAPKKAAAKKAPAKKKDEVFPMLLQVSEETKKAAAMASPKVSKAAPKVIEEKLAPTSGAQGIYEEEYMAPPSGEETLDSMDSVFDAMVQVDATYEDSRPTPEGEEREDRKDHRGHFKSHKHMRHTKAVHHAKAKAKAATHKEGAEPVKAHKFHTKASKQVTVLEETPEDDDEPEPEDDSFDRDEPIGAGAGDFVEEGDDEMAEEFQADQKAAHIEPKPPAKLEVIEEDAPKAAPAPVSIGLKSDKGATIALAESKSTSQNYAKRRAQVSFAAPRRARYGGEDGFIMQREEYQESQTRLMRRAQRNTLLAAYKKLEFAGDTKEEKYQRKIHADNAEIVLDEIQGINPDTGRREQWMAKNPVDED